VGLLEDRLVLAEARDEQVGPAAGVELVPFGHQPRVLLEAFPRKELGAKWDLFYVASASSVAERMYFERLGHPRSPIGSIGRQSSAM
jgi:hypothetical protein